jgi:hypothetical protein
MALRVVRGLFRLWLVLSVLWIGWVSLDTWSNYSWLPYVDGQLAYGKDGVPGYRYA